RSDQSRSFSGIEGSGRLLPPAISGSPRQAVGGVPEGLRSGYVDAHGGDGTHVAGWTGITEVRNDRSGLSVDGSRPGPHDAGDGAWRAGRYRDRPGVAVLCPCRGNKAMATREAAIVLSLLAFGDAAEGIERILIVFVLAFFVPR